MSYFNGPTSPDDYEDGYSENSSRRPRGKLAIAILLITSAAFGSTFAANISLNGGQRKEFGQGIYQIKACDQWVGVGLTAGQGAQNTYVANVKIFGLDPRACKGTLMRIKFFPAGSTTALPMYLGAGTTTAATDSVTATTLVTKITNAAYTGNNSTQYQAWAYDAVSLVDPQGRDIGFADNYELIDYFPNDGYYSITFTYPRAVAVQVSSVTIETAKYS